MFVKFIPRQPDDAASPRGGWTPHRGLGLRWGRLLSNAVISGYHGTGLGGQWKKLTNKPGWWEYLETDRERAWANDLDRKYLSLLIEIYPDKFLEEMTPNSQHDGVCVGLDLNHPHHVNLQGEFQGEVKRICKEKGLTDHPALADLRQNQHVTDGGSKPSKNQHQEQQKEIAALKATIVELQAKNEQQRINQLINEKTSLQEENLSLLGQVSKVREEKQGLQAENKLLKQRIAALEASNETLQEKVTQFSSDKEELERKLAAALNPRSSWLRVWEGKYTLAGQMPEYEPVAAKVKGCAIGFIARTPKGKSYLAKLGLPDTDYKVPPSLSTRKHNYQRSIFAVVTEKIGADVYAVLGHGFYYVPKHRLARLKILNPFTESDPHANAVIKKINQHCKPEDQITEGVHLLSRWMEQYRDIDLLEKCLCTKDDTTPKAFLACLAEGFVPEYANVEGQVIPILGLMEILAASRLLADTDVLGGGGKNAGFVVERDAEGIPMAVRMVKVDAGEAFNFSGEENQLTQSFNPISTAPKLKDPKDLQFGNQQPITIPWSGLLDSQKNAFLHSMRRGLALLRQEKLVDFFLCRHGEFDRAAIGKRIVMIEGMVSNFKKAWQRYQEVQTMPKIYGDVMKQAKGIEPNAVPFRPKMYGAVNHQADEAMRLSMEGT